MFPDLIGFNLPVFRPSVDCDSVNFEQLCYFGGRIEKLGHSHTFLSAVIVMLVLIATISLFVTYAT